MISDNIRIISTQIWYNRTYKYWNILVPKPGGFKAFNFFSFKYWDFHIFSIDSDLLFEK